MVIGLGLSIVILVVFVLGIISLGCLARSNGLIGWLIALPPLALAVYFVGPFGSELLVSHGEIWVRASIIFLFFMGFVLNWFEE